MSAYSIVISGSELKFQCATSGQLLMADHWLRQLFTIQIQLVHMTGSVASGQNFKYLSCAYSNIRLFEQGCTNHIVTTHRIKRIEKKSAEHKPGRHLT